MSGYCPNPGKRWFYTKASADKALKNTQARQTAQGLRYTIVESYKCRCGKFHHTSQPNGNRYHKSTGPDAYARRMALIQATREHYRTG